MTEKKSKTLRSLAKETGVSHITISRYFNQPNLLSKKTKEQLDKVLSGINYTPNRVASIMAKGRTGLIGVIVPKFSKDIFGEFAKGLYEVAREHDYQVLFYTTNYEPKEEYKAISYCISWNVEAIITAGINLGADIYQMATSGETVAIATLDATAESSFPIIGINPKKAAFDLASSVLKRYNYQNIAYLNTTKDKSSNRWRARRDGIIEAVQATGKQLAVDITNTTVDDFDSGYLLMKQALEANSKIDLCFFGNDSLAFGGIQYCLERGDIKIPDDIAICGFNNAAIASHTYPQLTTVEVPYFELGKAAVSKVINTIKNNHDLPKITTLPHKVMLRSSTK